jgi:hypothetical protein
LRARYHCRTYKVRVIMDEQKLRFARVLMDRAAHFGAIL